MKTFALALVGTMGLTLNLSGQEVEATIGKPLVRFISVDSVSKIGKGQKVKLDFRTRQGWIGVVPLAFPGLRGSRQIDGNWIGDTVSLTIDDEEVVFFERKGKTVDWYQFMLERLESTTYRHRHVLIIPHSTIQEIRNDSMLIRLHIELYKQRKNKNWKKINVKVRDTWMETSRLDGFLISDFDN